MSETVIQKLVLLLAEESDLTRKEMGEEIGKSPAWVEQKVNQARRNAPEQEAYDE